MIGIVILDYNNALDTIKCIQSVQEYTPEGTYKIIVVENGSNQKTINSIIEFATNKYEYTSVIYGDVEKTKCLPFITIYINSKNEGYARGNNHALRLFEYDSSVEHILILNNDIIFVQDIVSPLLKYSKVLPNCGIISPMLLKGDGIGIDYNCARLDYKKRQFFWEYLFMFKDIFGIISHYEDNRRILKINPDYMYLNYFEAELPSGACMLLNKETFRRIGYFDERTFLYFEENILYRKLNKVGLRIYIVPQVKCIHMGASTSQKQATEFIMRSHIESNIYYLRQYRKAYIMAWYIRIMSFFTILKIKIKVLLLNLL